MNYFRLSVHDDTIMETFNLLMPVIDLTNLAVPGHLRGKERAGRHFNPVTKTLISTFNPRQTAENELMLRDYAERAMFEKPYALMEGPILISVSLYKPYPASWSKKKCATTKYITGKPDTDNIQKLINDAFKGVVWKDDSQIAASFFVRMYDDRAHVEIAVGRLA
jgi:Holliday junction resolvase RusA-like endonuclease